MQPTSPQAVLLNPAEGRTLSMLGVSVRYLVESAQTGGPFAIWEYSAPAQFAGAPPHLHRQTDETFYIVEGTPTFTLNGQSFAAAPGAFVFVPRGTTHQFSNLSDAPLKMITFRNPGGTEGYFDALIAFYGRTRGNPTPAELEATAEQYDQYSPDTSS